MTNTWLLVRSTRPDVSDTLLDARPAGISGSVRELLLHVIGAQETLVLRTRGRQHEAELTRRSAWPGWDELLERARQSADQLIAIAEATETEQAIELTYQGRRNRFPLSFFLTHAAEHGVEHRTEIKVGLAQLSVETPDVDGWPYAVWAGYGQDVGPA
jgi:uncharacterized damage-inducible protein DinB